MSVPSCGTDGTTTLTVLGNGNEPRQRLHYGVDVSSQRLELTTTMVNLQRRGDEALASPRFPPMRLGIEAVISRTGTDGSVYYEYQFVDVGVHDAPA